MNFFTPKGKPIQRFIVYLLAIIIFLLFYFLVAGVAIGLAENIGNSISASADYKQLLDMIVLVITRTACGAVGIAVGMLLIREPFRNMLQIPWRPVIKPFIITFLLFTIMALIKDAVTGIATNNPLQLNGELLKLGGVLALALLFAIVMVPVQSLVEEVVFRSFTGKGFAALINRRWFVMLVSGILFSLNHGGQDLLYWLTLSILLMLTVFKSNGIIHAWAIHAAHNFYFMFIVSGSKPGSSTALFYQPQNEIGMWIELAAVALTIIILGIVYKWRWHIADIMGKAY